MLATIKRTVKNLISEHLDDKNILFRVIDINSRNQEVTLQIIGRNAIFCCSYLQVICDPSIMLGLSSEHACWIGIHYGRVFQSAIDGRAEINKTKRNVLSMEHAVGQYILNYETRRGMIGYVDSLNNKTYVEPPVTIASNSHIINKFSPVQAVYIGILAGIALEKDTSRKTVAEFSEYLTKSRGKTTLRLVC